MPPNNVNHNHIITKSSYVVLYRFRLFSTFLLSVPLLVVIWSYPGQGYNSATGHLVWPGVQSPTGHSFRTYIINFKKHAQDIFSHVLTSLTNCFSEYEQLTLYNALV